MPLHVIPRWIACLCATSLIAAIAAGCGSDGEPASASQDVKQYPAGSELGRIQERGELTIGVKYDVPPFGFKDPKSGDVAGFDVEMGRYLAQALGVKPKFIEAISDNRIPFLQRGTVDVVLSTMTINRERAQQIDFSDPYLVAKGDVLAPKNSPAKTADDLSGKRVCVAVGSTYVQSVKRLQPKAQLKSVDTFSECLELVQTRAVDGVATDDVILAGMIIQDRSLHLLGLNFTNEPWGAGVKKGDDQLLGLVNRTLRAVKRDGRWQQQYDRWIKRYTGKAASPPTDTAAQVLRRESS